MTAVVVAVLGYVAVSLLYRWFPPITAWTGVSLLAVAVVEAAWAFHVRARIGDGKIGDGPGRLHPLAVARAVMIAKASAWVGAVAVGFWASVLAYVWPRRGELKVAGEDAPGVVVAVLSALALVFAALWLEHCCKSPDDPSEDADGVSGRLPGTG